MGEALALVFLFGLAALALRVIIVQQDKIEQLERVIKLQMLLDQGRELAIQKLRKENKELRDGNISILETWWDQS